MEKMNYFKICLEIINLLMILSKPIKIKILLLVLLSNYFINLRLTTLRYVSPEMLE